MKSEKEIREELEKHKNACSPQHYSGYTKGIVEILQWVLSPSADPTPAAPEPERSCETCADTDTYCDAEHCEDGSLHRPKGKVDDIPVTKYNHYAVPGDRLQKILNDVHHRLVDLEAKIK